MKIENLHVSYEFKRAHIDQYIHTAYKRQHTKQHS